MSTPERAARIQDQIAASTLSRNSRFARALAAVASGVSPTAQHSTMIGPLNPADFSTLKTLVKSTLPVPNWIITSPFGSAQSFAQNPVTYWTIGLSSSTGSLPV